jgi:hypothetical protein
VVAHAGHASAPLLFDYLRIEQRGPRHPAGLGRCGAGVGACSQAGQQGLVVRPGNGFGSCKCLVERLADWWSAWLVVAWRRSHTQSSMA